MIRAVLLSLLISAGPFSDTFDYPDGSDGSPTWYTENVQWEVSGGAMEYLGGPLSFALFEDASHGSTLTVEARVTPRARTGNETAWPVAGVAIRWDGDNFWHFALVESPDDQGNTHSIELSEMLGGVWNAHWDPATTLTATAWEGTDFDWQYDQTYRLRISMSPAGVEGYMWDSGDVQRTHIAFSFDNTAVTSGQPALHVAHFEVAFDDFNGSVDVDVPGPEVTVPPYTLEANETITSTATGFFHTEQIDGVWWLVDPEGKTFYMVGTDHISYNGHWCEALGYAPYRRNVETKYGSESAWADATAQRLNDWGFNMLSAGHSDSLRYRHFAHTEFLSLGTLFSDIDDMCPKTTWTGFPNVFSPKWAAHCAKIARNVCEPYSTDPWLIGYFLDNELEWYGKNHREWGLFDEAWKKPADHTAKQAWVDFLSTELTDPAEFGTNWGVTISAFTDLLAHTSPQPPLTERAQEVAAAWVRLVAEEYFRVCRAAIQAADPNHLILGCRFASQAPGIWDIAGEYCDIVSFNMYPWIDVRAGVPGSVIDTIDGWHDQVGKPMMITEWSFPALDSGLPCTNGAGMRVDTQTQKTRCFRFFQTAMFRIPYMVGSDYFMYIDQPPLGISSTFPENSNYGLITEDDDPWPQLTAAASDLNPRVYDLHAAGQMPTPPDLGQLPDWLRTVPDTPVAVESVMAFDAGRLRVEGPVNGHAWRLSLDGRDLGEFFMLAHEKLPADHWVASTQATITDVHTGSTVTVVDMELAIPTGGSSVQTYSSGWRFWIPQDGQEWVASQCLWVENTDSSSWTLENVFHYLAPGIDGDPAGDEPLSLVPNYYRAGGAWMDSAAGLGVAAWVPNGEAFRGGFWKDEGGGLHSDLYQPAGVVLSPGERFMPSPDLAFFFALEDLTLSAFGQTASLIETELAGTGGQDPDIHGLPVAGLIGFSVTGSICAIVSTVAMHRNRQ